MAKKYTVREGDSLWQIAQDNNMSLDELIKLNPTKEKMIHPNDVLRLEPDKITREVNVRDEWLEEDRLNLQNITAIQGYKHDSNYVVVDKKNRQLTIYDKNNNPLYTTSDFSTGASGNDYNTITYTDEAGRIRNHAGNNSTPAGITEITNKSTYHGYPSFIRSRINRDGSKEDIASSFHWGRIGKERNASNGCVRVGGKTLQEMEPYLSTGTKVYTLPEKGGSRFTLKGGKLNFTADTPYGISLATNTSTINERKTYYQNKYEDNWQEEYKNNFGISYNDAYNRALTAENKDKADYKKKYGQNWEEKYNDDYNKRFWDDYNVNIDRSYSPLRITWNNTGNREYDINRKTYAQAIVDNKKSLQERFGLTSDEYNHLANLALGIAEQESKFGTSDRYKLKQMAGEDVVASAKGAGGTFNYILGSLATAGTGDVSVYEGYQNSVRQRGEQMAISRGITQIKNKGDNKELQKIYSELGIDDNSIKNVDKAAIATIARLAYMYNNEVKGRNFVSADGNALDPYHALMYKWIGKNYEILGKTATPLKNTYIRNVNKYSRQFNLYDTRTYNQYKYGGRISLEEI